MSANVFIKPRLIDEQPALVRDPSNGKPLAVNGEWKTKTQFWIRRIAQGDVVDCTKDQIALQNAKPIVPLADAAKVPAAAQDKAIAAKPRGAEQA